MNIAIVDDEAKEIETLASVLREYAVAGQMDITIHAFCSAEEILQNYHPYAYTAIFMDVYMDGLDGVSAARQILAIDRQAVLIFLTSSDQHMPEAFSLHAYDYIGKPAKKERIFKVMDDVMIRQTEYIASPRLTFTHNRQKISLPYLDIVLIRTAARNYLEILDASGTTYCVRLTFSDAVEFLSNDHRFLLILRGVLVNMDFIKKMEKEICELADGTRLSLNVKNAKELTATWQNYKLDCIRNERRRKRSK